MATERGEAMAKLTLKQKRFAERYVATGNATQSAISAGYSAKSAEKTGYENLSKPHIKAYIAELSAPGENKRIMDLQEALEISSSIARGELQTAVSRKVDKATGEVLKDIEYTFTPSIEDRQKSLEHIIRCNGGFIDRQETEIDMDLHVVVDYGDD